MSLLGSGKTRQACYGSAMIQIFEDVLKGLEFCNFHSSLGKVAVIHEGSCAFRGALRMSMVCMRTSLI